MGSTLRVEPIGARLSRELREARPINAVEATHAKAGLFTRAPLWGTAVMGRWPRADQSARLRAQLRSLVPGARFFPRLVRALEWGGTNAVDAFIGHAFSVFMGFFAIMNPIANTPVFLGLTAEDDPVARRKIAAKALIVSFVIIAVFSAAGKLIFDLFGITLPAFRIMGGTLVALIGYRMLQGGEHSSVQHPSEEDKQKSLDAELEVAITPLAMPILAGPGTIATAMNFASAGGVSKLIVTVGAFFVLCVISYVFFVSGERLVKYIGDNGIKVVTRLMGLILAVIGVQMLIQGIGGAVTEFQKMGVG